MRALQTAGLRLHSCGRPPVYSCFLDDLCSFRPECSGFVIAPCIHVCMRKCSPGECESAATIAAGVCGGSGCCAALQPRSSRNGATTSDWQAATCTHRADTTGDREAPGTGLGPQQQSTPTAFTGGLLVSMGRAAKANFAALSHLKESRWPHARTYS